MNRTLSCATTWGHSGPGSDGNEGVLHIPQITGASPSDCLVPYPGHSLEDATSVIYCSPAYCMYVLKKKVIPRMFLFIVELFA